MVLADLAVTSHPGTKTGVCDVKTKGDRLQKPGIQTLQLVTGVVMIGQPFRGTNCEDALICHLRGPRRLWEPSPIDSS